MAVFFTPVVVYILALRCITCQKDDNPDNLPSERKVHKCPLTNNQFSFNVIPGKGWDNLENIELGQVFRVRHEKCISSFDGNFLIPDDTIMSPLRKSIVRLDSDLFTHYSNYTSLTSKSINAEANYATPHYQISGSFSWENQAIKNNQIKSKSLVSRVEIRYRMYTVTFQPDTELDPKFRNRLLDIGAALQADKDDLYPDYLSEMVIRDFGTHVVRSVEAGAILSKTDVLSEEYTSKNKQDITKIQAAAAYSMTKKLGIKVNTSISKDVTQLEEYEKSCLSTTINMIGGQTFKSDFSIDKWEESLDKHLVAIDRRGDPLYYSVTTRTLPEFDYTIVNKISGLLKKAINTYYAANTRIGCMDMKSPNFNDEANVDSGDCEEPDNKFFFGGIYQECNGDSKLCNEIIQTNPLTGGNSCPLGYKSVLLQDTKYGCRYNCYIYYIILQKCILSCANYRLYWCAPTKKNTQGSGYLFGGIYTNTYPNPITNTYQCPQHYTPLRFGSTSSICVSRDNERALKEAILFGGFYSCNVGNPLTVDVNESSTLPSSYWQKGCATGYSTHTAVVDKTCQISYCAKSISLKSKSSPPLQRPPFLDMAHGLNTTGLTSFITPFGATFTLSNEGNWEKKPENKSVFEILFYSTLGTFMVATFVAVVILGVQKYRNRFKQQPLCSSQSVEPLVNNFSENGMHMFQMNQAV